MNLTDFLLMLRQKEIENTISIQIIIEPPSEETEFQVLRAEIRSREKKCEHFCCSTSIVYLGEESEEEFIESIKRATERVSRNASIWKKFLQTEVPHSNDERPGVDKLLF